MAAGRQQARRLRPVEPDPDAPGVGAQVRASLARAAACADQLGRVDVGTLLAVYSQTSSYGKLEARVTLGRIAAFAYGVDHAERWQVKKVGAAMAKLQRLGILDYRAGKGATASVVTLKCPDSGGVPRPQGTPSSGDGVVPSPVRRAEEDPAGGARKDPVRRAEEDPAGGAPIRGSSEVNPEVHTEEEHEDERPALRSLGPGASDGAPGEVDDIDDEARLLAMCRGNLDSLYPVAERAVYWLWFLSGYGDDARDVIDAAEATGERFRHPFDVLEAGLIALRSGMRRSDIERDLLDDRRRRAAAQ